MPILHTPTWRLNTVLFLLFLTLAVYLGLSLPDRYPVHFDLAGEPTRWEERGIGMWVLLVAIGSVSFGQLHLFQRFLLTDPDSRLLNVPYKEAFFRLPRERRIPVFRRMNRLLGLLNTSLLVTFTALLLVTWWSAHQPGAWPARASLWSLWLALAFALVFPLTEVWGASRMIRRKLEAEGLWPPDATPDAPSPPPPPSGAGQEPDAH
jgi:uncharacterized membrane protein